MLEQSEARRRLGLAATFATAFIWAWPTIFIKILSQDFDVFTQSFYRYLAAAAFFVTVSLLLKRSDLAAAARSIRLLIVPAFLVALFQICMVSGVYMTNASTAGLVSRMNIVFIVLLSYVFFESERGVIRSRYFLPANALVVAGVLGLVLGASEAEIGVDLGVLVTILGTAFWAAYIVSLKKLVHELEPLAVMPFIQGMAAAVFLPLVLVAGDIGRVSTVGWGTNLVLVVSGIFCVGAGNVTNYVAIRHLGSTLASNIIAFKPLLTVLFAYMILGEVLAIAQLASGILLILGCWVIVRKVSVQYEQ